MSTAKTMFNIGVGIIVANFIFWILYTTIFLFIDGWHWKAEPGSLEAVFDSLVSHVTAIGLMVILSGVLVWIGGKINNNYQTTRYFAICYYAVTEQGAMWGTIHSEVTNGGFPNYENMNAQIQEERPRVIGDIIVVSIHEFSSKKDYDRWKKPGDNIQPKPEMWEKQYVFPKN